MARWVDEPFVGANRIFATVANHSLLLAFVTIFAIYVAIYAWNCIVARFIAPAVALIFWPAVAEFRFERHLDLRAYIGGSPKIQSRSSVRGCQRFVEVLPRWGLPAV
jgi:hypothetical protein